MLADHLKLTPVLFICGLLCHGLHASALKEGHFEKEEGLRASKIAALELTLSFIFDDHTVHFSSHSISPQSISLRNDLLKVKPVSETFTPKLCAVGVTLNEGIFDALNASKGDEEKEQLKTSTGRVFTQKDWDRTLYRLPVLFENPSVQISFKESTCFDSVVELWLAVQQGNDYFYKAEPLLIELDETIEPQDLEVFKKIHLSPDLILHSFHHQKSLPFELGSCLYKPYQSGSVEDDDVKLSVTLQSLTTTDGRLLNLGCDTLPFSGLLSGKSKTASLSNIDPLIDTISFVVRIDGVYGDQYVLKPTANESFKFVNHSIKEAVSSIQFCLKPLNSYYQLSLRATLNSLEKTPESSSAVFGMPPSRTIKSAWSFPFFNAQTIAELVDHNFMAHTILRLKASEVRVAK